MTPDDVVTRLRAAGCVFAEREAALLLADGRPVTALVARREAGEPLEQVLGWAEFDGHRVTVRPGVFVPRRRSELLVRLAADGCPPGAVVVDLCCGSGALGLALRHRVPDVELHAVDVDGHAVACARVNLPGARVWAGDLWGALPVDLRGRLDVVLANAPYVPSDTIRLMPREAREHEPRGALDGGTDGLTVHRRIAAEVSDWLAPGGRLLIEVSPKQLSAAAALLAAGGLTVRRHRNKTLDATALVGTRIG